MPSNLNVVALSGHLTRELKMKTTPKGVAMCIAPMASNDRFAGRDCVTYVDLVSFGKFAENFYKYGQVGMFVEAHGRLRSGIWGEGEKRHLRHTVHIERFALFAKDGMKLVASASRGKYEDVETPDAPELTDVQF